jgi:hypothetical protein
LFTEKASREAAILERKIQAASGIYEKLKRPAALKLPAVLSQSFLPR